MPINILMPALSPTMTEGKLSRWLKQKGDQVSPGDVLAEIETDKATMEVEAVDEGRLADIRVAEGTENVAVNTVIAVMLGEEEADSDLAAPDAVPVVVPKRDAPAAFPAPAKPDSQQHAAPVRTEGSRIIASPLAKRVARDRSIDLSRITGSGPRGRIVRADLDKAPSGATPSSPRPAGAPVEGRQLADLLGMAYKPQPNSTVRKTIARRLTEAKQTIPHFYLSVDCEIDFLTTLRAKLNEHHEGARVSVNDFVIKAAAAALQKVPAANASWSDDAILLYEHSDISVAVATDNGLITPIIKKAEVKPILAISAEMKDLGTRARAGKLKPEEYQGGTFSVSNLGMYGIKSFSAIINPPQACILAVGAGEQRPIVREGKLEIATMMSCTLSVDHRAVDGAIGAQYLAAFKSLIENPLSLIL